LFSIQALFGYYLAVFNQKDASVLKNLDISCEYEDGIYVCAQNKSLFPLLKLKSRVLNAGINAYILNYSKLPPQNGYCVQVLSSKKLAPMVKIYEKIKNYPYARLEKIGDYYSIRIGEERSLRKILPYLRKVRNLYPNAFARKCEFLFYRMVLPKFVMNKKRQTELTISQEEKNNKITYEYYLLTAKEKIKEGKYENALRMLNQAMYFNTGPQLYETLGDLYFKKGNLTKALKYYESSYSLSKNPIVLSKILRIFFIKNRIKEAEKMVKNGSNLAKSLFYAYYAEYYLKAKKYKDAMRMIDESIFYTKTPTKFQKEIKGVICYRLKKYKCAFDNLKGLNDERVNFILLNLYLKFGYKEKARKLLKSIDTSKCDINQLAKIYLQLGELEKAAKLYGVK
jgi:tetratricopeptide (TPR) repeat protein